ncbi:MAG: hypothetical protein AAF528_00725 [Cyanobacteria bacterium P01_C01_bin.121]
MLPTIIAQLEQLIAQAKASGPVAGVDARLDISTHSKSGHEYARLRNGSQLKSCGRVGSEKHLEVLATLQRRDAIAQLTQAIASLKRADEIPVAVPGFGKVQATVIPSEVMAVPAHAPTAKFKSKVKPQSKTKTAIAPRKKKAKGRQQLYTHVKTKQGSVVHAVLGKDKVGVWHTPALCGATPPQRDRMGWEFPTHDDGVTCSKCYRKLPANGKRHLPKF